LPDLSPNTVNYTMAVVVAAGVVVVAAVFVACNDLMEDDERIVAAVGVDADKDLGPDETNC
jgi:hypothetical protein